MKMYAMFPKEWSDHPRLRECFVDVDIEGLPKISLSILKVRLFEDDWRFEDDCWYDIFLN